MNIISRIGPFGLSLVGGGVSFLIGWFYLDFYYFSLFVGIFSTTLFFIGGFITILGAILYKMEIPSSGIVILIGAIMGGINIISLWGGIIVVVSNLRRRRDEDLMKAEKVLSDFLRLNQGKAFTATVLHKDCIEVNQLKVKMSETEKILHDLYLLGRFRLDVTENVNYYFVS